MRGFLAAAIAAVLLAPSGQVGAQPHVRDLLTITTGNDILSWDVVAHLHSGGMPVYRSVFDSAVKQDADLTYRPWVVKSHRFLDAEGKRLELTFRDDVLFHNGDKLTAEDFQFTMDRILTEKSLASSGIWAPYLQAVEVVSPTVAVMVFKKTMPTAIQWLGAQNQVIQPKKYFTEVGKVGFNEKPIGSGPYKVVEWQRGARIVLEANENYWAGKPFNRQVVFNVVRDPATRVALIQARRTDIVEVPVSEVERLSKVQGLAGLVEPITSILMLHLRHNGSFLDKNVRLAAHHAIDKAAISRALFLGKAPVIDMPGPPSMPSYDRNYRFPYDPKKAADYLAASGYGPNKPAKLTLFATNGVSPNDWQIAQIITAQWRRVGIEANLEVIEPAKFYELNHTGKLPEATLWQWSNPPNDPELNAGSILNPDLRFSVWKTDDMRTMLAPLLVEPNYEKRIAGYAAVNRYAMDNVYNIPLLQAVGAMAHDATVDVTWFGNGWYEPWRIGRK